MDSAVQQARAAGTRTSTRAADQPRLFRGHAPASLVWLAAYLAATLLLFRAVRAGGFAGDDGDAKGFIWYLDWVPHALTHGWNPFLNDQIQAPHGVSLMWNTSVPLLGLLLWPITATAGAVASYNVALVAGVTLSGFAAFAAARRFCVLIWPAGVAGALYAYSPFVVGESLGHLHFAIAVLPPVVVLLLHSLFVRRASPRRVGLLLGAACAAQLLVGEELLLTSALMTLAALAILAAQHPSRVREELPRVLAVAGLTVLVVGAVDAYPLALQLFGPGRPPALGLDRVLVSDIENTVVPTWLQWFAPDAVHVEAARFTVVTEDTDAYLGIPLLIALVVSLRCGFGSRVARIALPVGAVALLLSLGSTLVAWGHTTGIPLPWALLHNLPLLDDVVPARLVVFTDLALALVVAAALDDAAASRRSSARRLTLATLGVAVISLLPSPYFPATADTTPAFFAGGAASRIREGVTVAISPWFGYSSMLWQERAGMRWRITGGEGLSDGGMGDAGTPVARALEEVELFGRPAPLLDAAALRAMRADLRSRGVEVVIVGPQPHQGEVLRLLMQVMGAPPEHLEGVDVFWQLPA